MSGVAVRVDGASRPALLRLQVLLCEDIDDLLELLVAQPQLFLESAVLPADTGARLLELCLALRGVVVSRQELPREHDARVLGEIPFASGNAAVGGLGCDAGGSVEAIAGGSMGGGPRRGRPESGACVLEASAAPSADGAATNSSSESR